MKQNKKTLQTYVRFSAPILFTILHKQKLESNGNAAAPIYETFKKHISICQVDYERILYAIDSTEDGFFFVSLPFPTVFAKAICLVLLLCPMQVFVHGIFKQNQLLLQNKRKQKKKINNKALKAMRNA